MISGDDARPWEKDYLQKFVSCFKVWEIKGIIWVPFTLDCHLLPFFLQIFMHNLLSIVKDHHRKFLEDQGIKILVEEQAWSEVKCF